MKNINKTTIVIAISTLLTGVVLGWLLFSDQHSGETITQQLTETSPQVWTCSMHPSVRQSEPGKCPICGMDLIPVDTDNSTENPMEIKMSAAAMQLANIRTSVVSRKHPEMEIRLNGKVQPDEQNIFTQTAHIAGRIEKLMVDYTGEYVRKGQEIALVYSPLLVTAQEELFEAYKIRDSQPDLYNAAREKLKNWKLSETQIDHIIDSAKTMEKFPVLSDINGVVLAKNVNLGDYVSQGAAMYKIADLSRVWILFDVYESDLSYVKEGNIVEYTLQSLPGQSFTAKISFIDPVIDPKTRVAKARISVNNSGLKLKPEMFASGNIKGSAQRGVDAVVVPKSAVMWTGKRSLVYVKYTSDAGVSFEMREVTLGPATGDRYIIEEGLEEGEEIATHGTFSIDAAAQLAGKPSMMNPSGDVAMTTHNHGQVLASEKSTSEAEVQDAVQDTKSKNAIKSLFDQYLKLKDALVSDSFVAAKQEGSALLEQMNSVDMSIFAGVAHDVWMQEGMKSMEYLREVVAAGNLAKARDAFKPFSEHIIRMAQAFRPFDKTLYIQHCPMADDFKGANWLSTEDDIMNPYFGASMLKCGEVTGEILTR